jgi:hypothetical protein
VIVEKFFPEKSNTGRYYQKIGKKIFPFFPEFTFIKTTSDLTTPFELNPFKSPIFSYLKSGNSFNIGLTSFSETTSSSLLSVFLSLPQLWSKE